MEVHTRYLKKKKISFSIQGFFRACNFVLKISSSYSYSYSSSFVKKDGLSNKCNAKKICNHSTEFSVIKMNAKVSYMRTNIKNQFVGFYASLQLFLDFQFIYIK